MNTINVPSFDAVVAQSQTFVAPLVKASKLSVANLEKLTAFQFEVLRSYADLGVSRLAAAAEVTDVEGLKAYTESSVTVAKDLGAKVQADTKTLTELLAGFKAEFDKLAKAA